MNFDSQPIIIPFFKMLNGVQLILWDRVDKPHYAERAEVYEQFTLMSEDYAMYTPVKFESL
jgi:hypothetical protein